jgi:hypothetical protein
MLSHSLEEVAEVQYDPPSVFTVTSKFGCITLKCCPQNADFVHPSSSESFLCPKNVRSKQNAIISNERQYLTYKVQIKNGPLRSQNYTADA